MRGDSPSLGCSGGDCGSDLRFEMTVFAGVLRDHLVARMVMLSLAVDKALTGV